jgi:hypothetical protein
VYKAELSDAADSQTTKQAPVVRKNSIRLPSDRDAGTYLFGFPALGSPKNRSCEQKMLLSRAAPVQS